MKIKKIHIYRMPGFPTGLKAFEKLAGNINVIAGPNGSGKSSTARIIQKLIWWDNKTIGYQVDAQIEVQGEKNDIEIDSQSYTRTDSREKTHEDFSFISSAEFSNQYMLALHDLVRDNDDNLASIIAREVNGGVDLGKVSDKLGYKESTPNLGHAFYKEYERVNGEYQRYVKEQAGIKRDEDSLSLLEEEKKLADDARKYIDWYEKSLNYLQAKERYTLTSERINQFPAAIAQMKEGDFETIDTLEQQLNEANTLLDESANSIQSNNEKISNLRISHSVEIPEELLYELTDKAGQLKDSAAGLAVCEKEIVKLQGVFTNIRKNITPDFEIDELANLNLRSIHNLDEFTRSANEVAGIHANLQNRKKQLEKELISLNNAISLNTHTANDVKNGISILSLWLKGRKETTPVDSRQWLLWLFPVLSFVCVLAGFFGGTPGLIAGIVLSVCVIPLVLMLNNSSQSIKQDDLFVRISDYQNTKLPAPVSWESESVAEKIQELLLELDKLTQEAALTGKLTELTNEIEESKEKLNEIEEEFSRIRNNMGILPENIEPLVTNYNSFYVFLCNILKLQDAETELEKQKKEKELLSSRYQQLLDEINTLFGQVHFKEGHNTEQVSAILHSISREMEIRKDALNEIDTHNKIISLKEKEKAGYLKTLEEIYTRLKIPFGQKNDAFLLNTEYQGYRKMREQLNEDTARVNANYKLLEDHILFTTNQRDISELTVEEAQAKIEEYKLVSGKQEGLLQRISDIKAHVKEKITQNDIEISLNRKEEALSNLDGLLKNNLKSLTGSMIISQLHNEISLNNENRVFKRANKTLGSITKGRYSLILSEGLQPVFKAYDNIRNQVQSLKEISTGTRVQLLLAIRLAYIESQENSIRLPLLADELLANSDDERSEAIIRSLIEISRNRQLFYFTAQADEVEKWSSYLKANPELDSEIVFLPDKMTNYSKPTSGMQPLKLVHDVYPPDGLTHAEYGVKTGVPFFDILEQEATEMHLWYLIEDTTMLFNCLKRGFYQWGQLNSFLENGGILQDMDTDMWEVIKTKTRLFDRLKSLYSIGRCRKMNMDVLIESGTVTETYLDKMSELLVTEQYDPAELLKALDQGAVKGFRTNKKEDLRNFLLERGYLSNQPVYSNDELHVRINAIISNLNIDSLEAERFINRFIAI